MNSAKEIVLLIMELILEGLIRLPKLTGLIFAIIVVVLLRKIARSHFAFFQLNATEVHLFNMLAIIFAASTMGAGVYWLCTTVVRFISQESRAFFIDNEKRYRIPLTSTTRYRCAVHEVGHLLAYKWYDTLPKNLQIYVTNDARADAWGAVSHAPRTEHAKPIALIHDMYVLLAGNLAEICVLGKAGIGASRDLEKWEAVAKRYLSLTDAQASWFAYSKTEMEAAHNLTILQRLKREQILIVEAFIQHNKALLEQGANQLIASRHLRLTHKQITALLDAVTFPVHQQEDKAV